MKTTEDQVHIACVTDEVVLVTAPAIRDGCDRVHLIHYVESTKTDRADYYRAMYDSAVRELTDRGIEVVEHSGSRVYVFAEMMREVHSILLSETSGGRVHIGVNISGGTPEYAAAAAICAMMFDGVDVFTTGMSYKGRTVDYGEMLRRATVDGRVVGSCSEISDTFPVEKLPIDRPDDNLLRAFKVYDVIRSSECSESNSNVIRNLINLGIWLNRDGRTREEIVKGTSLEFEDPSKGYACLPGKEQEHGRRQRNEAVQYYRIYVSGWMERKWIRYAEGGRRYVVNDEGRNVLRIFCPESVFPFSEDEIVVQSRGR